jgi:hypothetical protein
MDGTRFDEITQRLASAATRRRIVGGILGGTALLTGAALAHFTDADAKKGKGKGKGHGKGNGGNRGKGKGRTKVFICHKTKGGGFNLIRVGAPAVKGHSKHSDTVCVAGVCETGDPTGCDQDTGACVFDQAADGTECTVDDQTGTCTGGVCVTCGATGASCVADEDCCEGLTCGSDNTCAA